MHNVEVPLVYQDMVTTLQCLKFKRKFPGAMGALDEFIFANSVIKQENGEPLYYLNWVQKGILKIRDIWENNRLATMDEIGRIHNIPVAYTEGMRAQYMHIKRAIPQNLIDLIQEGSDIEMQENQQQQLRKFNISDLFHVNKGLLKSKNIYERLMCFKLDGFQLGLQVLDNAEVEEDKKTLKYLETWWKCLYRSNLDNKLQEFQWRLSHNALYTFPKLNEIDPNIPRLCIMCQEVDETLIHLFSECRQIRPFWQWISRELRLTIEVGRNWSI